MKIFPAKLIKEWDRYTIENEPISSIDLMERASTKAVQKILQITDNRNFSVVCGPGNNGGDGLAIARLLWQEGKNVKIIVLNLSDKFSNDFNTNLERIKKVIDCVTIESSEAFNNISFSNDVIIDCILGTGLTRPAEGFASQIISTINNLSNTTIAIDVPSGIFSDQLLGDNNAIKADYTLTFQTPKEALLWPEHGKYVGKMHVLDISLAKDFLNDTSSKVFYTQKKNIKASIKSRSVFDHKGNFGHTLMIGGSYEKIGAIQLATHAALRTGSGLVSTCIPKCGYTIMQVSLPEAMVLVSEEENFVSLSEDTITIKPSVIGIGPGIGKNSTTFKSLETVIRQFPETPFVIDADALNIISENTNIQKMIPANSVLTPHLKEFDRLVGAQENHIQRLESAQKLAYRLKSYVVLKGAYTAVVCPNGEIHYNSTGNPGMATGGTGDVLCGMIASLIAQNYDSKTACILGTFLHGLAGDLAIQEFGETSLLASDLINYISKAFISLK